ncbi:hypothetical protein C8R43DRAFT_1116768 [Mycena crocata]|nr:hypothetical protein C8R43DRAFT_1116768 [Mycena crocata]
MKFTVAFLALLPIIYASPAPESDLTARALGPGNINFCADPNLSGDCLLLHGDNGECVNIPAELDDKISSAVGDPGQTCFLFTGANCTGDRSTLANGEVGIPEHPVTTDDAISSFQ